MECVVASLPAWEVLEAPKMGAIMRDTGKVALWSVVVRVSVV